MAAGKNCEDIENLRLMIERLERKMDERLPEKEGFGSDQSQKRDPGKNDH